AVVILILRVRSAARSQRDRAPSPGGFSRALGVTVEAIHRPFGEQEGQIQLREKSTERSRNRHWGGADVRIWLPSLGSRFPPPDSTSRSPHHDRKSP